MRVILDGNLPRGLARHLIGHIVHTIHSRRWSDLDDGALLDACATEYDAFVTMDQSLQFQQDLSVRLLSIILLHARSNRLPDLVPLVPAILAALPTAAPGQVVHVGV